MKAGDESRVHPGIFSNFTLRIYLQSSRTPSTTVKEANKPSVYYCYIDKRGIIGETVRSEAAYILKRISD